jgi:DNA adenine methylase
MTADLRAPFPYFGGKSRAAALVWERFGKVVNYVEPFAGSVAVLLACPEAQRPRVETVNDANCFLANFWRATKADPEAVATHADWPVNETDLHARHRDLLRRGPALRALLEAPHAFDVEAAGWWVWGASAWIGSGWCEESAPKDHWQQPPDLGSPAADRRQVGRGIHAAGMREPSRQLPDLVGNGEGTQVGHGIHGKAIRTRLFDIFAALSERLRYTRVACGDWARICTPAVTYRHGLTAVFLDPPYDGFESLYGATEAGEPLSARVRAWALEMGERADMRIALAGYEGEHAMPGWECVPWKAKGGYGNQGEGNENAKRERLWFSPACLRPGVDVGQITHAGLT